ncbi:hypothetical protein SLEP1_g39342 [Rubroshorea leprosula]|uniref:PGG domain-containing protein n=1 Tax=Rubroshorea leprosula TaxID=152421 RepID=A0AAV5KZW8_9ROSI|nr:hypothetical protein SLEP1_g39342 [Rubroshorea leprosula]
MDERMRRVAQAGNIDALYALIQENPFVLESFYEFPYVDTPLHLAAFEGHIDFALEMMTLKSSFARKLNPAGLSPLHLALLNHQPLVVRELVRVDKDLIRVKGRGGLTSLHLATEIGDLDLVAEFLEACPECITDATIQGETAIQIAAKNNSFETLELLVRWLQKTTHKDGQLNNSQTRHILHRAGCLKAEGIPPRQALAESLRLKISWTETFRRSVACQNNKISGDMRNAMLVVAVLILTSTYQACLNPPGGVSQGNKDCIIYWMSQGNNDSIIHLMSQGNNDSIIHRKRIIRGKSNSNSSSSSDEVGVSVMPYGDFAYFYFINTATFLATTLVVFFLLPDETINLLTLPVLLFILCYLLSMIYLAPPFPIKIPFSPLLQPFSPIIVAAIIFILVCSPKFLDLYLQSRRR